MSSLAEPTDPFEDYCQSLGVHSEEDKARAFELYVYDSTGWDGQQFSLTEDERHWIIRANECLEWLRLAFAMDSPEAWSAVKTTLAQLRPIPKSLELD